jgi:hypothetical protein
VRGHAGRLVHDYQACRDRHAADPALSAAGYRTPINAVIVPLTGSPSS